MCGTEYRHALSYHRARRRFPGHLASGERQELPQRTQRFTEVHRGGKRIEPQRAQKAEREGTTRTNTEEGRQRRVTEGSRRAGEPESRRAGEPRCAAHAGHVERATRWAPPLVRHCFAAATPTAAALATLDLLHGTRCAGGGVGRRGR